MKWLRRLSIIAVGLVAVLVAAGVLLPRLIDADTLRTMLILAARHHTGRELTVDGDIRFAVLPRPAVVLPHLALADAEGFGPEPFASIDGARVNLRLWPLLWGRLQMSSVQIDRPRLRLTVDTEGRSNWRDLLPAGKTSAGPTGAGAESGLAARVGIAQFTVHDADILWTDRRSGRWARLRGLDVSLDGLDPARRLLVEVSTAADVGDPLRTAQLEATATVQRANDGAWRAPDLRVGAVLAGASPSQPLALRLAADASLDPARQRLRLRQLALDGDPLQVHGELTAVRGDDKAPVVGAQLRIERLDARAVLQHFGVTPATADPAALTKLSGRVELGAGGDEINLARLELQVDDSRWQGTARLGNFAAPAVRFALDADRLDLDRYLPAKSPTAAPAESTRPPATAPQTGSPAAVLRRLSRVDLDGTLGLATLTVRGLTLDRVAVTVRAGGGQIALKPLDAGLYGGTAEAGAQVDARSGDPTLRVKLAASDVAAGPLLAALTGHDTLQGRFAMAGEVAGAAAAGDALLRSLHGTFRVVGSDGVLKGVNVDRSICQARGAIARLRDQATETCDPSPDTRFSALRLSGPIAAGVWRSDDLLLEQQRHRPGRFYRLTGTGTLDLPSGEIDYRLKAAAVRREGPTAADDVKEAPVPVRVRGRPGDFTVRPQIEAPLREEAVRRLRKRLETDPLGR